MKVSIKFTADIEIESDDDAKADAVRKTIQLQAARLNEYFEAVIIERVQPLHPDCKFNCGPSDED